MLRYFIILALISGVVIGPTVTANAEAIRFDLGMGATDYFSIGVLPVAGSDALQLAPRFAPIEGLLMVEWPRPLFWGQANLKSFNG